MGLDMFLHRVPAGEPPLDLSDDLLNRDREQWEANYEAHQKLEVAYWRKANHIHAWFVDHIQDGVDECDEYPVSREQLAGLVSRCQRILDLGESPEELLPTRSGFFFGSTEYDESYYNDLRDTIKMLSPLLMERNLDTFVYHSSW